MADVNVLVVFYSRRGKTEKLALAAGVGAIQARANIRLRRVADRAAERTIDTDPEWRQALDRMKMDYVEPRPIDAEWADLIVVAAPPDAMEEIVDYVERLGGQSLSGKTAAPIVSGESASALQRLCAACTTAGLVVADSASPVHSEIAAAGEYGRQAVEAVRSRRISV